MYRADPARTKVSDGSGLGLSVCRQIVELHGGTIWATSRKGQGLSIYISLPKKVIDNE
jgi:two-component system sensor histidine kinase VicK